MHVLRKFDLARGWGEKGMKGKFPQVTRNVPRIRKEFHTRRKIISRKKSH